MLENGDPQVSRVTVAGALLPSPAPLTSVQLPLRWIWCSQSVQCSPDSGQGAWRERA